MPAYIQSLILPICRLPQSRLSRVKYACWQKLRVTKTTFARNSPTDRFSSLSGGVVGDKATPVSSAQNDLGKTNRNLPPKAKINFIKQRQQQKQNQQQQHIIENNNKNNPNQQYHQHRVL